MLLTSLLLTSGCWDRREVETLAFVTAVGLDLAEGGPNHLGWKPIDLSVQVAATSSPEAGSGIFGGGSGASAGTGVVVTARGYSSFDALTEVQNMVARQIYVAHNRVIVVSEDLARSDMRRVLDFFDRNRQPRRTATLVIAKDITARDAISAFFPLAQRQGEGLYEMIQVNARQRSTANVSLHEFLTAVSLEGVDPFVGAVQPIPNTALTPADPAVSAGKLRVSYAGIALFQRDRLVGFLDETEGRGLLWAIGKSGITHIRFPCPGAPGDVIVVEILRSKGVVRTEASPEIRGVVEVTAEGMVIDASCASGLERTPDSVDEIHNLAAEELKSEVEAAVSRAKELQSDPFGFGAALFRKHPRLWNDVKEMWYSAVWPNMPVDVKISFDIRRPGLVGGPYTADRP